MAKKENNQKHIVEGMPWAEVVSVAVVALCMVWAFRATKLRVLEEQVNKHVELYEKTIPGYLEQKQLVEQYRESLMRGERQ